MSTPPNGSPDSEGTSSSSGSQHSAPDFGGGWQQNQGAPQSQPPQTGSGSSQQVPSYGAPGAAQQGPSQTGSSQPSQSSGAPQYRPAGGGTPQFTPAGGHQGGYQASPQGGGRKGKGKPPLWVGLVSLGLGVLLGIVGIVVFFATVVGGASSIAETPSGTTRTLEADTDYFVFSTSTSSVDECTIYTPEFDSMSLEISGTDQTATSDGETFSMLGSFETSEAGEYRLSCSPYVASSDVYITDVGVGGMLGGAFAGIGIGLLGGLLFIVGIVLIIVNRVTASKNRS